MYNTDRHSMEFIKGVHKFIDAAKNTSMTVSFVVHAKSARTRRITHQ
jgi:hypothetical protein